VTSLTYTTSTAYAFIGIFSDRFFVEILTTKFFNCSAVREMARDTATNSNSATEEGHDKLKNKAGGKSKEEKDKKDEVEELVCLEGTSWVFYWEKPAMI
jgi:hypothetical protein